MKQFVYIYHTTATEAPSAEMMQKWGAWLGSINEHLVDSGRPINGAKAELKNGEVEMSGDSVIGYAVVKADNMDDAIELARGNPLADAADGSIRVYETGEM